MSSEPPVKKRKLANSTVGLAAIACAACRKKHYKCDKKLPSCSHCLKCNRKCEYLMPRKRGPKKVNKQGDLAERIKQLENQLKQQKVESDYYKQLVTTNGACQQRVVSLQHQRRGVNLAAAADAYGYMQCFLGPQNVYPTPTLKFPQVIFDDLFSKAVTRDNMQIYAMMAFGALLRGNSAEATEYYNTSIQMADRLFDQPCYTTAVGCLIIALYQLAACKTTSRKYLVIADSMCSYMQNTGIDKGEYDDQPIIAISAKLYKAVCERALPRSEWTEDYTKTLPKQIEKMTQYQDATNGSKKVAVEALQSIVLLTAAYIKIEVRGAQKFGTPFSIDLIQRCVSMLDNADKVIASVEHMNPYLRPWLSSAKALFYLQIGNEHMSRLAADSTTEQIEVMTAVNNLSISPFIALAVHETYTVHKHYNDLDMMSRDEGILEAVARMLPVGNTILAAVRSGQEIRSPIGVLNRLINTESISVPSSPDLSLTEDPPEAVELFPLPNDSTLDLRLNAGSEPEQFYTLDAPQNENLLYF